MKNLRGLGASLITGSLLLWSGSALASPFQSATTSQWRMVKPWHAAHGAWRNMQLRLSDCDVLVKRRRKPPSQSGGTRQSWRFDARDMVADGSSHMKCKSGQGNCVKFRTRPSGRSWRTEHINRISNDIFGSAAWRLPLRCAPGYLVAPSGLQWNFRSGNGDDAAEVPLNDATIIVRDHERSPTTGNKTRHASRACRVSHFGADFIGEVRDAFAGNRAWVWTGGRFSHTKRINTAGVDLCEINAGPGSHLYLNFEYLSGNVPESRWATLSGTSVPNGAAPMGTVDGGVSYLCVRTVSFRKRNKTTRVWEHLTQNYIGWWKAGQSTCHVLPPRSRASGWEQTGVSVRILKTS